MPSVKQILLCAAAIMLVIVCFWAVILFIPVTEFDMTWSAGIFILSGAVLLHNYTFNRYYRADKKTVAYVLSVVPLLLSAWLVIFFLLTRQPQHPEVTYLLMSSLGFSGFVFLAGLGMNGLIFYLDKKPDYLENEMMMKQLELDHLRNQVNPHFLFNSLNNVAATIQIDPEMALDYTYKLAALLRYQIESSDREYVNLGEEVQFLLNYLGIEKVRLGTRCDVTFTFDVPNPGEKIPPMLLQPLVEKVIKQSICLTTTALVRISLVVKQKQLTMDLSGSVPVKPANPLPDDIGLTYVKRRLGIFFPGSHSINEVLKSGYNDLSLRINLEGRKRIK